MTAEGAALPPPSPTQACRRHVTCVLSCPISVPANEIFIESEFEGILSWVWTSEVDQNRLEGISVERTGRSAATRPVWLNSAVSFLQFDQFCSPVGAVSSTRERWEEGDQGSSHLQEPGGEPMGDPPLGLKTSGHPCTCLFIPAGKSQ